LGPARFLYSTHTPCYRVKQILPITAWTQDEAMFFPPYARGEWPIRVFE
jgi:hypothetical protein